MSFDRRPALEFARSPPPHEILGFGRGLVRLDRICRLSMRCGPCGAFPTNPLRRRLREARNFGLDTLDYIISSRTDFDYDFRKDYLSWHIHYHLGTDERRGIARFIELLRKHNLGPVYEPRFVLSSRPKRGRSCADQRPLDGCRVARVIPFLTDNRFIAW
jgi:hypothetical protein